MSTPGIRWGFTHPTRPPSLGPSEVAILEAALLQIALVVFLGAIEGPGRDDLGRDGPREPTALVEPFLRCLGLGLLFVVVVEDDGAILGAEVGALPIHLGRVVRRPEDIE